VSLEPDRAKVAKWVGQTDMQIRVALAQGELLGPLSVNQVPSTVFVDSDGMIVAAASGERSRRFFMKRTADLFRAWDPARRESAARQQPPNAPGGVEQPAQRGQPSPDSSQDPPSARPEEK
jgi:hypothetical protein